MCIRMDVAMQSLAPARPRPTGHHRGCADLPESGVSPSQWRGADPKLRASHGGGPLPSVRGAFPINYRIVFKAPGRTALPHRKLAEVAGISCQAF